MNSPELWASRFPLKNLTEAEEESLGQENGNDNQAQCYCGTAVTGWLVNGPCWNSTCLGETT